MTAPETQRHLLRMVDNVEKNVMGRVIKILFILGLALVLSPINPAYAADDNHVVEPGDTLSSIATAHGMGLAQLVFLNQISPAQRLMSGQVLVVQTNNQDDSLSLEQSERVHIVKPGENLGIIAQQYGIRGRRIVELNKLSNVNLLKPGQELMIPPPDFDDLAKRAPIGDDGYHTHPKPLHDSEKWIDVDLSEQRVVAYEGATPVSEFIVSTGKQDTPTVTGTFRMWAKTPIQDMYGGNRAAGDYYYLADVEWVQYFYNDYGFHGTYWHDNFGQPMSRGCVNMRDEDAKWLYEWAGPEIENADRNGWVIIDEANQGTSVVVHE
jgi:LysM repeat protein